MITGNEDDPELRQAVAELQAGARSEAHSRRVFELFYPRARRFFGRLGYGVEDSEDLAQEVLSRVLSQIGTLQSGDSFKSWVFAVAANLHRNEGRRRHREKRDAPEVSLDATGEDGTPLREPPAPEASPAREAYEKERREALARAVQELPPQMGKVLSLRIGQDLKYREIAVVLQISIETVKAHLFQARQRLRSELGEAFGEWVE